MHKHKTSIPHHATQPQLYQLSKCSKQNKNNSFLGLDAEHGHRKQRLKNAKQVNEEENGSLGL